MTVIFLTRRFQRKIPFFGRLVCRLACTVANTTVKATWSNFCNPVCRVDGM